MPRRLLLSSCVAAVVTLCAVAADAVPIETSHYFTRIRTPLGLPAADDLSILAVDVDITETANRFNFTVTNDTAIRSALTMLIFEQGLGDYMRFSKARIEESDGVRYRRTTLLKYAPGRRTGIDWTGSGASFRAFSNPYQRKLREAVNNGSDEVLTISFLKRDGATLADVLACSETDGRVVVHLRDVGGVNVVADLIVPVAPTPEPASALLLLAGALAATGRRTR